MKTDLGGILRMRHSKVTSKQVQKVVGVGYGDNPPAFLAKTLNRSQKPCRTKNLLEQVSSSPFSYWSPAGLKTLEVFHK